MASSRIFGCLTNRLAIPAVLTTLLLPVLVVLVAMSWASHTPAVVKTAAYSSSGTWSFAAPQYPGQPVSGQGQSDKNSPAVPTVYSDSPLAPDVMNADMELFADRANSWNDGKLQMILLDRQVSFTMGTYGFQAEKAVVRIETEQRVGQTVRHIWIYLEQARPLQGRGPLQGEAGLLLVTTSTTGDMSLLTNLLTPGKPANEPFVASAQERFTRFAWAASQPTLPVPEGKAMIAQEAFSLRDKRRAEIAALAQRYRAELPPERLAALERQETRRAPVQPPGNGEGEAQAIVDEAARQEARRAEGDRNSTILPTTGSVLFQYDRVAVQPLGDDELAIVFMGNVSVAYEPTEGRQGVALSASNVVVFVRRPNIGGQLPDTRIASAKDIRGIYLEDNVQVTNGQFTVRSPRVFYDLTRNKAVVLDAVMYAYDARMHLPIYVRAQKLRQESLQSWTAQNASLTTSEFAEPTLTLSARQITFSQETKADGGLRVPFEAQNTTVHVGKIPVFIWPKLGGDINANLPIREVDGGWDSHDGPFVTTQWDLFGLMGRPQPEGVDLTGQLDFRGERGPAVGVNFDYDLPRMFGLFEGYLLPYDEGEDRIGSRNVMGHDGDARGYYSWRHRQEIQGGWELSLESAAATDETFLEEFFPDQATESKPWETSVYLKKQQDDWAFTFLVSYDINDFAPQTTTLQAPGYRVDKLPELGYYRVGTSLWDNRLTYFTENSFSRMRLRFGSDKPKDRGFDNAQSLDIFGIPNTTAFGDSFRGMGYDADWRTRFDSRHELQAPMQWGFIDAVPYISGRLTAYDDDFDDFAGETENARFFGTAGLRLHSQFHRTFDEVESSVLNIHRLRHQIEPMVDINYAGSSYNPEDVPVYDDDIEGLQEGASFRFGLRNTLQTQRGGPGRWRNVDWLILNTNFVVRSDDANPAIIPEYYGYRPEYGKGGDHFHTDLMWMISDSLAAVGELVYDFENDQVAYWRVGASMQHSPVLTSFMEYSEIDPLDSRLLSMGLNYRLTRKWSAGMRYTFDLAGGKSRDIELTMVRELHDWRFAVKVAHDDIDDRQTASIVIMPNFVKDSGETNLFSPVLAK